MKRRGAFVAILVLVAACGDDGSSLAETDGSSSGEPASTTNGETTTSTSPTTSEDVSSETTDAPSTTTDAPGLCSGTCAAVVPDGWTGPVKAGDNAVDCNGGFADPAGAFFTDFDPGEKSCACDCQPVDAACADTVEVQIWGEVGCVGAPDFTIDVATKACAPIGEGPFPPALSDPGGASELSMDFVTIGPVVVESGTCEGVATFNEGGFADSVQLCAPTAEPSMCEDGGPCIADNTDVCVWQEGEHDCPDGYPELTTGFGGSDDQRECGTCDCGVPEGVCDSSITLQTEACVDVVSSTNADCEETGNADIAAATYDPGPATITCGGTGTAPLTGRVEPTGVVTICCAR